MSIYTTHKDTEDKRNWKIFFEWIDGKDWKDLSIQFNLSKDKIQRICLDKVPFKVRNSEGLSKDEFRAYRAWRREHKKAA